MARGGGVNPPMPAASTVHASTAAVWSPTSIRTGPATADGSAATAAVAVPSRGAVRRSGARPPGTACWQVIGGISRKIRDMTDEIWRWDATRMARAIARREISSREAVSACLERMAAVNPRLNAVTVDLGAAAGAAADRADAAVARGDALGPLHGVPVTIKENIDQAGCATTNGVVAFRNLHRAGRQPRGRELDRGRRRDRRAHQYARLQLPPRHRQRTAWPHLEPVVARTHTRRFERRRRRVGRRRQSHHSRTGTTSPAPSAIPPTRADWSACVRRSAACRRSTRAAAASVRCRRR